MQHGCFLLFAALMLGAEADAPNPASWSVRGSFAKTRAVEPEEARVTDQAEPADVTSPDHAHARRLRSKSNPIVDMIIGFGIWCCILPCAMWMNERIAMKQSKLQGKAVSHAIDVEDVNRPPLEQLNGHIVFMSGNSQCKQTLTDKVFPAVQSTNCVKLRRIVQMQQWVEHVANEGASNERVTYDMQWKDERSRCPKAFLAGAHLLAVEEIMTYETTGKVPHTNPPMPCQSSQRSLVDYRAYVAAGDGAGEACAEASLGAVLVGAYFLGEFVLREMDNWRDHPVSEQNLATNVPELNKLGRPTQGDDGWWYWGTKEQIGDVRVKFEKLECGPISLCGILSQVERGWTVVPIIREEGNAGESCAQEFGFSCAWCPCTEERPVFSSDSDDDDELLEWLEEHEPELTDIERTRLLGTPTGHEVSVAHVKTAGLLQKGMHWLGLEEEFLGVAESHMDFDEMLAKESMHSRAKHCACRGASICIGWIAAAMIVSPLTYMLNYHWLITMMGGGLLSCAICAVASLISMAASLMIIAVAWAAARPRLTCVLFLIVALLVAGIVSFFAAAEHHRPVAYPNTTYSVVNATYR